MSDPLRERLIARLVSGPPTFRYVPGDDQVKIVADDLADAMLEIVDSELGRLRRIEHAARAVADGYYGAREFDDLRAALVDKVARADEGEKR